MTTPIIPGCESYSAEGGSAGVLVLHGFTGSPASMRPLAEHLADAGFTVELPRLPGHGTTLEDMMTTSWSHWSAAALAAYDELAQRCERVGVVGLSMGGGLTAYVAEHREVAGCVFINPLVKPPVREMLDGLDQLLEVGVETIESIGEDIKHEGVHEFSYDATPLRCAKSLFEGVDELHANLALISAPSLLLSSREDHVVTSDNGGDLVARVSGPIERVWLENSYHVATLDFDRDFVETSTVAFMKKVLSA